MNVCPGAFAPSIPLQCLGFVLGGPESCCSYQASQTSTARNKRLDCSAEFLRPKHPIRTVRLLRTGSPRPTFHLYKPLRLVSNRNASLARRDPTSALDLVYVTGTASPTQPLPEENSACLPQKTYQHWPNAAGRRSTKLPIARLWDAFDTLRVSRLRCWSTTPCPSKPRTKSGTMAR